MSGIETVFMPERVFQLDEGGVGLDNLLFRGNVPLVRTEGGYVFGYLALEAQLQKLKALENPSFRLDDYYLIVIMMLDVRDEYFAYAPEVASFNDFSGMPLDPVALSHDRTYPAFLIPGWNPTTLHGASVIDEGGVSHHGSIVWWPIEACAEVPCNQTYLGPGNRQSYNFTGLIDFIHTTVQGLPMAGKPLLLYMHCLSGVERTGATATGYAMQYLGLSFAEAMKKAANSATPDPPLAYQALACAYCHEIAFPGLEENCSDCSSGSDSF